MNRKVLNRPMFARMRDGSIKPVQYHWVGAAVGLGSKAIPWAYRGVKAGGKYAMPWIKKGIGGIRNYMRPGGGYGKGINAETAKKFPGLASKVKNAQRFNITSMHPANIALQSGVTAAPFAYNWMKGDDEKGGSLESVMPAPSNRGEGSYGRREQAFNEESAVPQEKKIKITETITEDIKSGSMDEMIKDKITLFEKYLGKDTDKRRKGAAYEAMVEFGLNFATARGGNTMDKIARSAKDPLKNFAAVGREIVNRAEKIKMAGIESGITAYEKAEDRSVDREAIASDVYIEQMKLQAPKMDRLTFIDSKMDAILKDPNIMSNILAGAEDEKGNRLPGYENKSDGQIVQEYVDELWSKGNATEIPPGAAGKELWESLPSGTLVIFNGEYIRKP